eukprot:scaffold7352_cov60-Cylindrotheca_fusiformis.AAC.1
MLREVHAVNDLKQYGASPLKSGRGTRKSQCGKQVFGSKNRTASSLPQFTRMTSSLVMSADSIVAIILGKQQKQHLLPFLDRDMLGMTDVLSLHGAEHPPLEENQNPN